MDPKFAITFYRKVFGYFKADEKIYFEVESDEFFSKHADVLNNSGIDVAFIDGLHTYEQSLKDVENCLRYLNEKGVIVMHDCKPTTYAMAFPAKTIEDAENAKLDGWTGEWCGDVWKTIVHLRSSRPDLEIFVLDCDYGVGVIIKGTAKKMLNYNTAEIPRLTFYDLWDNREMLLNIKSPKYLSQLLKARI